MSENRDGPDDVLLLGGDAQDFGRFYALHEDYVLTLFLARGAPRSRGGPGRGDVRPRARRTQELRPRPRSAARLADGHRAARPRRQLQAWEGRGHRTAQAGARAVADRRCRDSTHRGVAEDRALTALEALPEDQRVAVRGRVLEEADYTQLANALGCSPSVVRQRVSRGLRALRERLKESA